MRHSVFPVAGQLEGIRFWPCFFLRLHVNPFGDYKWWFHNFAASQVYRELTCSWREVFVSFQNMSTNQAIIELTKRQDAAIQAAVQKVRDSFADKFATLRKALEIEQELDLPDNLVPLKQAASNGAASAVNGNDGRGQLANAIRAAMAELPKEKSFTAHDIRRLLPVEVAGKTEDATIRSFLKRQAETKKLQIYRVGGPHKATKYRFPPEDDAGMKKSEGATS